MKSIFKSITFRFIMLMAIAAVAPLFLYGIVSVNSLRTGTRQSVSVGNRNVAARSADEIQAYVLNSVKVLQTLGAWLQNTNLSVSQQDRIIKNYALEFPEYRRLTLIDDRGKTVVTSGVDPVPLKLPSEGRDIEAGVWLSAVKIDDDYLPTAVVKTRVTTLGRANGWLVGELNLEQMWRMVDAIHVGDHGYALVVAPGGLLLAHGDPDKKELVARGEPLAEFRQITKDNQMTAEVRQPEGKILATGWQMSKLDWIVVVEQPTREAYAAASQFEWLLIAFAIAALGVTTTSGYIWGRSFINRIAALRRGTRALAEGRLEERVSIPGQDEIAELGTSFNTMADKLGELRENLRRQERQVMFGRIAGGLVHDLSHPIQNIVNQSKLIVRIFDDAEYRETFRDTVEREAVILKRILDDLRNLAKPVPLEHFPIDINRSVAEVVQSMQPHAETAGLALKAELSADPVFIEGDVFALGRVYRNLIINAIQATAPGGLVVAQTESAGDRVQIRFYDTGCGIPAERLAAIFDDFVTTKRRGLGLGLAVSKKLVEQLGGIVSVASEVGKGTTFVLDFPATAARPAAAAEDRIA